MENVFPIFHFLKDACFILFSLNLSWSLLSLNETWASLQSWVILLPEVKPCSLLWFILGHKKYKCFVWIQYFMNIFYNFFTLGGERVFWKNNVKIIVTKWFTDVMMLNFIFSKIKIGIFLFSLFHRALFLSHHLQQQSIVSNFPTSLLHGKIKEPAKGWRLSPVVSEYLREL